MKTGPIHDIEVAFFGKTKPNVGEKIEFMGFTLERTGGFFSGDGVKVVGFPDWVKEEESVRRAA